MLTACSVLACSTTPAVITERAVLTLPTKYSSAMLFFTVQNAGPSPLSVVSVTVDGAETSSIETTAAHRMPGTDTTAAPTSMLMLVDSLSISPHATQRFAPGGFVVVARRFARPPQARDSVRFTVTFSNGTSVRGVAEARPYDELDVALGRTPPGEAARLTAPSIAAGRELYLDNGCASCHGRDGHGDGPIANTLAPRPRDFRANAPYRNGHSINAIAQTLATGIPNGGQMPLFAHLTDAERRALAMYVRSLREPPFQDTTP